MNKKRIGYARVSMSCQDLALQLDALKKAEVSEKNIYIEKISGRLSKADRPELAKCLNVLEEGDTLVVWKMDRLGRSIADLINIIHELDERKIHFQSLTEIIDTGSHAGRLLFHVMASFAEFERSLIKERAAAGIEAARKRGVVGGRPRKLSKNQQKGLVNMYKSNIPISDILETFNISKTCLYDYLHLHNAIKPKK